MFSKTTEKEFIVEFTMNRNSLDKRKRGFIQKNHISFLEIMKLEFYTTLLFWHYSLTRKSLLNSHQISKSYHPSIHSHVILNILPIKFYMSFLIWHYGNIWPCFEWLWQCILYPHKDIFLIFILSFIIHSFTYNTKSLYWRQESLQNFTCFSA